MKNLKAYILIAVTTLFIGSVHAQTINWANLKAENKHIVSVNAGWDYGAAYGVGYGYQVKNRWFPIITNVEFSVPSGTRTFDDYKTKIGAQIRLVNYHNFQFSTKIYGIFRRYENDFVRMVNFGSDMSGVVGYYRNKWFVAGEAGFDKSIVTHFKHSDMYKDQYAGVVDGWYEPATGGNFYYGLQAGYTYRNHDLFIRAGKVLTQDFKTSPTVPFYGQLGYNIRF